MKASLLAVGVAFGGILCAQEANPTQNLKQQSNQNNQSQSNQDSNGNAIFKVQVVSRSIKAVSYRNRSGWTKIDFQGTALAPKAKGKAEINSRKGYIQVKTSVEKLPQALSFGGEYLTYVLWAITPDGRPKNLGELLVNQDGNAEIDVTTELQAFGLIVTAEPYFAVTQPSDVVVMENILRQDTVGKYEEVDAKYELLPRGMYVAKQGATSMQIAKGVPIELYEARNAVMLARGEGADKLATDVLQNATNLLQQAEDYQARKAGSKPVIMTAREAVQKAEDARLITKRREREIAMQKAKDDAAKAQADAEAAARQQQLAEQQAQQDAARRAEAERAKADADAARARANAEAERARVAAEEAERLRAQAETEKNAIRQQMMTQLNQVLETRETARGLIMNMSDVLFDFGKYTLKPEAREKLAKVSGILLSHPGLMLQVEGHTDNIGSDEYNQKLSDQRADAVRDYLITQGIQENGVTAKGMGKNNPIAPNDTNEGRQKNRRVEIVVSGSPIGTSPTTSNGGAPAPTGTTQGAPATPNMAPPSGQGAAPQGAPPVAPPQQ
jgi:outer membrane protein OmpA-like peptidoglycan-associated protein